MNTFGDRLRAARSSKGLTQDELAERIDVTKAAVSAWENNRDKPTLEKLQPLRDALTISLDVLVCGGPVQPLAPRAARIASERAGYDTREILTRNEQRMLRRFRNVSERRQKAFIVVLGDGDSEE